MCVVGARVALRRRLPCAGRARWKCAACGRAVRVWAAVGAHSCLCVLLQLCEQLRHLRHLRPQLEMSSSGRSFLVPCAAALLWPVRVS